MSKKYYEIVQSKLKDIYTNQNTKIIEISKLFYKTYKNDGLIYLFGTGHSHMLAEDVISEQVVLQQYAQYYLQILCFTKVLL